MNFSKKSVVSSGFFFRVVLAKVFNLSSFVTVLVFGSKPKKDSNALLMLPKSTVAFCSAEVLADVLCDV